MSQFLDPTDAQATQNLMDQCNVVCLCKVTLRDDLMKVTDIKQNTRMLYNLTLCKACLQRLVATNKFVRLKSHYAVLGVSNTATQKEIRDAYIKLSKKMHPDQNRHDTKSHEKFVKINEAYETLSKDSSRQNYDDTLRMRNQPRQHYGGYRASHRPPNYYSSGQFYEDQGPYSEHSHYNPYSKRNTHNNYDPFSSYGYEHYQRQSKGEEYGPDDFGVDWKFRRTVSRIYSLFIAIPFYFGFFYAINEKSKRKTTRSGSHEFFNDAALKRLVVYYVVTYVIIPYFILANLFAYIFRYWQDYSGSDSNSGSTTNGRVVLNAVLVTFYALAFLELVLKVFGNNNNNKHPNAEYFGVIRYTILLLLVPYLVLRFILLYGIMSQETATRSRTKPSYTSRAERKAAEERLRYHLRFFVIFICIFTGLGVLTEDRSIISRQQQQDENGQNEERQTYTATAEDNERDDRILVAFHRIWWGMAILMAIFMMWEVIIHVHIKVMTRGLEEEERHRKWQERRYNVFNEYSIVIRYATLIGIAFLYKKEAEAWERGTASKSKILLYLGLYATIVLFFSKQEVERRRQLKEQKLADSTKVYRKPTAGRDSS